MAVLCYNHNMDFREIVGWYGTGAILLAYFLVSFLIIAPTDFIYQLLNLTGAVGIVVVSLSKRDYPPAFLNLVWFFVALTSLIKIIF